ncbi:Putative disease resistance RPP13-like protein [Arachis hypogaea]|nr:Putative disease resistance RPP13-like protein [Arachis hypogaea]QHO25565.1 Putative disease resistance RPP13-like protein [Arachis hypogaea]QHO25566.1 Putative disease resistance RPP13-like protein [Arachis hypogaea]
MAARFVGEAFLNSALGTIYDMLISPLIVNLIQRKKLNRKLVEKLETVLKAAHAVINDAERRQIEEEAVKHWMDRLKDVVYDAEDILDEVTTKAAIQKVQGNSLSRNVNLHGDDEIVTKIEDIIAALESIVNEKDGLGLKEIPVEDMSWRIPSTSLVGVHQIYGRDQDREAIVKLLLDVTNDGGISVIPMVGMGGIGKTTLAQMVYNDDRVKQKFDVKAWVCDGQEEFDVLKVTKAVMEATSSSCNSTELNKIQESLKEVLAGKKLLVVLDDMWSNNYDAWISFLKPFKSSNGGVKILVTTRLDSIADMVKTIPAYHLSLLGDDHCWSVFADHACLNSAEPHIRSGLEVVGRKIVKKCNGLALAAQTLGGLLRARKEAADWEFILRSEIWEFPKKDSGILPALRISYHYLPSYLKRCFVYCSLFPKDYEFERDELVLLWMAEGLLQQPNSSGGTLEEVGYKYFNDLVSRSFLQHSETDENSFVMHDLMHDLAIFYGGKFFCRTLELKTADKHEAYPRHLSYSLNIRDSLSKFLEACDNLQDTRTLLKINAGIRHDSSKKIDPCRLLAQLKHVRVLSFEFFPRDHNSLPDSIGDLIHLRYLDLSDSPIVTLPESMCKCYNLQTLKLSDCERLEKLPSNMQDLVNLLHLDLSCTAIEVLPESLSKLHNLQTLKLRECENLKKLPSKMQDLINLHHLDIEGTKIEEMPKGMSKLKDLQILCYYIAGKHEENGIGELGGLVNLQGLFRLKKLENVVDSSEAWKARMVDKKYISDLRLKWSSGEDSDIVDSQIEKDVLSKLEPHNDLKYLTIKGYRGTVFPDWVGQSRYHNMTELELNGCRNCLVFPSLGQLPSLETLLIAGFDKVKMIGGSFYKADATHQHQETPFRSLKYLSFYQMSCWEEWESYECDDDDDAPFPKLEEFYISQCPKLRGDLPTFLPSLKKLVISGCEELGCYVPRAPILRSLRISGKQEARTRDLPLSMLETLVINGEQLVNSLFEAMTHTQPTSLIELHISECSSAISFPGDSLPPSLEVLLINDCKNVEFPMQHQQHESLISLTINNSCDSLTSFAFPAFPNLKYLTIASRENLTSLEVSQSQSLKELWIEKCPKLENITRLPASLRELKIYRCQLLGEGIERKDPHIWPSISHITYIKVDSNLIDKDSTS